MADDGISFTPLEEPKDAGEISFTPLDPTPEPDMTPIKTHFAEKLKGVKEASNLAEYLEAGWDTGATGLVISGKPDVVLPENAPMYGQIASGIAQIAGDLPAIVAGTLAGYVGGAKAGAAVAGPPGAVVGAAVGSGAVGNAAPEAIRQILMDHYEKGEFKNSRDFISRSMGILWETVKAGGIGGVTGGVGGRVAKVVAPVLESTVASQGTKMAARLAQPAAEIATMTTVGAALEGELPDMERFTTAGLMVATIHGVTKGIGGGSKMASKKMRDIYAKTGVKPEQVAEDAKVDPILQQELLTDDPALPSRYKELVQEKPEPTVSMADVMNEPPLPITKEHPAVKEFLSRIEKVEEKPGTLSKLKDRVSQVIDGARNARTRYQDQFIKLKEVDQDVYELKRMESDYRSKTVHAIQEGTIDFQTGDINGKGLDAAVAKAPDVDVLDAVLVARRHKDYEARGLKSGFDGDTAAQIREMAGPEYTKAADEVTAWNKRNLKYLADSEMISKEAFESMDKKGAHYIPLRHILNEDQKPKTKGKGGVLKRVKGTDDTDFMIQSPLVASKENALAIYRLAEKNRINLAFLEQAKAKGLKVEKVETSARPISIDKEVNNFLEKAGVRGEADGIKAWRSLPAKLGEGEFEVYEKGVRSVYKVEPEFAEALNATNDIATTGLAMTIAKGITDVKKYSITATPAFKVRNFIVDQLTIGVQGKAIPFVDAMVAIGDQLIKSPDYWRWMRSGGTQGSFLQIDDLYVKRNLIDIHQKAGVFDSARNILKNPKDFLSTSAQLLENATRLAEFKRVSQGATGGRLLRKGGFASRQGTVDFELRGNSALLSALSSITAFLNPSIQGNARFIEAFAQNPGKVTTRAAAYLVAPTVLLWWANRGNQMIENLPQWRKDLAWNIPVDKWEEASPEDHADLMPDYLKRIENGKMYVNNGYVVSIPRPFLPGLIFGAGTERSLNSFFDENPDAFRNFDEAIQKELTPSITPDIAAPIIEQFANRSLFTKKPIIPARLEKVAPELQYTNYTSEPAKQLGKLVPMVTGGYFKPSPVVVDNYIRSWGGPVGQLALQIVNAGAETFGATDFEKPESSWYENPLIGSFIARRADLNAASISLFYDRAGEIETKAATMKEAAKKGLPDSYTNSIDRVEVGGIKPIVTSTKKALASHRKIIDALLTSKMPKDEKRQLIDSQVFMMIHEAERAVELIQEKEKALEDIKEAYRQ